MSCPGYSEIWHNSILNRQLENIRGCEFTKITGLNNLLLTGMLKFFNLAI
jgi:hypothetical protein